MAGVKKRTYEMPELNDLARFLVEQANGKATTEQIAERFNLTKRQAIGAMGHWNYYVDDLHNPVKLEGETDEEYDARREEIRKNPDRWTLSLNGILTLLDYTGGVHLDKPIEVVTYADISQGIRDELARLGVSSTTDMVAIARKFVQETEDTPPTIDPDALCKFLDFTAILTTHLLSKIAPIMDMQTACKVDHGELADWCYIVDTLRDQLRLARVGANRYQLALSESCKEARQKRQEQLRKHAENRRRWHARVTEARRQRMATVADRGNTGFAN